MFKQLLVLWHTSRLKYHKALMDGCLDEHMREKLISTVGYHSNKINELNH